jgi:hypothetical protein
MILKVMSARIGPNTGGTIRQISIRSKGSPRKKIHDDETQHLPVAVAAELGGKCVLERLAFA